VCFEIVDLQPFRQFMKEYAVSRITNASIVHDQDLIVQRHKALRTGWRESFHGLNLGFTKDGLTQLIGAGRPKLDLAFERGADHPETIAPLHDPPKSHWVEKFISDRIDGVFLVTGADPSSVEFHSNELLRVLGRCIKVTYSEMGNVRPGTQRGHEHFDFLDGVSQPGIRGLTAVPDTRRSPDQGLPGQDLLWPGEFIFGYPGQHPDHPTREGPPTEMAAPWMRNGSFMVFRRLEQKVPEFRRFVRDQAARLGMDPELLAARMVGRWK